MPARLRAALLLPSHLPVASRLRRPRSWCARFSAPSPSSRRRPLAKLAARKREREASGRCEGRKPIAEQHPQAVAMARELAAVRKRKPSLRQISALLAAAGHLNELGKPFAPKSIAATLACL
jgi:hypothetical protein